MDHYRPYVDIKDWFESRKGDEMHTTTKIKYENTYSMMENNVVKWNDFERELKEKGIYITQLSSECGMASIVNLEGFVDTREYARWKSAKPVKTIAPVTPKKVIFSGPATTILWTDGTKTTVKCSDEDVWEDEVGIAMCYLKKLLGNKGNYNNIFREAMKVAVVAEPKAKDTPITITTGGSSYVTSAYDDMSKNIDKINKRMKDVTDALSKGVKEKE